MIIVETSLDKYVEDLKELIDSLKPTYVLGGLIAIQTIKENKLLLDYQLQHTPHYDNRELCSGLSPVNNMVPISSYNLILFEGFKIIGQIYLDSNIVWEKVRNTILKDVSNKG